MADGVPAFGAYSAMKAAFGGIRPAIVTNGYAWTVFRAIREDMPWRDGLARVFPSIEYIEEHFTEFWNLLSYESIGRGSLDEEFGSLLRTPRRLDRVIDRLFNANLPLQRNRLHAAALPNHGDDFSKHRRPRPS